MPSFNSINDFCVWGPHDPNSAIGPNEETVVAYCTNSTNGARPIPAGTFSSVHWVQTPDYVQVRRRTDDFAS